MPNSFSILHLAPLLLGFVAIWLLLPQVRRRPLAIGVGAGVASVLLFGLLYLRGSGSVPRDVLFAVFAVITVVSAACMITQHNPVYAALWFALVILSGCGLYLLAAAPFLAAATVIVYAGAIIVTFLFVIMLAQQTGLARYDRMSREPMLAALGGFLLLATLLYAVEQAFPTGKNASDATPTTMQVLESRRERCQAILNDLNNAMLLLKRGESTEIVGRVLYVDSKTPETAVGTRLYVEMEALAPMSRVPLRAELERLGGQLGLSQAAGDRQAMLASLDGLRGLAEKVQARVVGSDLSQASDRAPLGSVSGLGRSLFTDYLIGVELAGTALLIATIGAILIAAHRKEGFR